MGLFGGGEDTVIRGNRIDQFDLNNSTYGLTVPNILGTTRIAGNVIDWQDFRAVEHRETTHSGKGGGGSSTTQISYTYTVASAVGICEGPANVRRIWADMDETSLGRLGATIYNGSYGQQPWSYMQSTHPDRALAYSGLCYAAAIWDLGNSSSLPQLNFEVQRFDGLANDGYDVNPADVIKYIVSDIKNGVGFGTGNIDTDSLNRMYQYAASNNMLVSCFVTDAKTSINIIKELCQCANTDVYWSQDKLKFVVNSDDAIGSYQPITTVQFAVDSRNFIPYNDGTCVKFSRKDSTDCYNSVDVEFTNRSNSYSKETATIKITADIAKRGMRQMNTVSLPFLHTKERASKVASSLAYRSLIQRNTYTFKLGWNFCLLEPGDLISLTDETLGLDNTVVEIQSVKESGNGVYEFTAVEKPAGVYSAPVYDIHQGDRPILDYYAEPGQSTPAYIFTPKADSVNGFHSRIAVSGYDDNWGGCQVWASEDNLGYRLLGTLEAPSLYGYINNDISAIATTFDVTTYGRAQLLSNPAGNELYLDGEVITYTGATLIGDLQYRLTGVRRGQSDTVATSHKAGANWADATTAFIYSYNQDMDNKLVYIKLLPFNTFKVNVTSIADVAAIPYLIDIPNPPDVKRFNVELLADGTRRYWWDFDYPAVDNIAGFRIKYIQGASVSWDAATTIGGGLITEQPFESKAIRHGVHTVMIKAVDAGGQESDHFASCLLNLGDLLEDNVLYRKDYIADLASVTIENGHIDDDGYITNDTQSMMWMFADQSMWTSADDFMWDTTFKQMTVSGICRVPAGGYFWFDHDIVGPGVIYYQVLGNESMWPDENKAMWTDANVLMWGNETMWKQYSTKVEIKAGSTLLWKVVSETGKAQAIIKKLKVVIDVPDRQEHFENIEVPLAGLQLDIHTPSYYTTAVRIDAVQTAGSRLLVPEIISRNPCFIKLYDVSGNPASATIDCTWQGFEKTYLEEA